MVHPAKAIIVNAGHLSRLSVSLDGTPIDTDLTAAQIVFWNQGNESIRKEHVLGAFTLHTQLNVPIIEATIRKSSRDVVHIEVDKSGFQRGEIGLSWNILEQGDGGILQVIFAGGPSTDIIASGVIEGQPSIRRVEIPTRPLTFDQYPGRNRGIYILALVCAGTGLMVGGLNFFSHYKLQREGLRSSLVSALLPAFALILLGIISVFFSWQPEPPFGF